MKRHASRSLVLIFFAVLTVFVFIKMASAAKAPEGHPAPASPHGSDAEQETGIISGTLLRDGKTPLASQRVALEIMRDEVPVLALPKETDSKGEYQFKNIFQTEEYTYAISTEYEGKIYRTDFVSLKKGEKVRKLDLNVGAGAKEASSLPHQEEVAGMDDEDHSHMHGEKAKTFNEYKLLALLAAIGVIIWAFVKRKKKA